MSRTRTALAVAVGAVVALTACTGGGAVPVPAGTPSATATAAAPVEPVEPVVVETVLDGETVDLQVGPLAVHDDAAVLRLAASATYPTLMSAFSFVFESIGSPGPNGVRVVDLDAGTVTRALRTDDDRVVMTRNGTPGGPATDAADEAAGDDVVILYVAFPVPDAATVDVLLPAAGWVPGVPVVSADHAGVLTVPPSELVEGAPVQQDAFTLEAYTEVLGGQVRSRQSTERLEVAVSSDVLFAFDSDQLAPDADGVLQAAAAQVAGHDGGRLTVVGHTDDQGDEAYNLDLSQRRAATVAARVAGLADLAAFDVAVEGRGETQPAVAGSGEAERALNRRVELVLETSGGPEPEEVVEAVGSLPDPQGPVAPGPTGVSVAGDDAFDVRLEQVRRVGRYVVGGLEVTNTGAADLSLGSLSVGAWDSRGSFDPQLQTAPTNVTLVSGGTRLYPVDYRTDPQDDEREPLSDRIVNSIDPGETRLVTVVWPDPGTDTVTVDVAPRFHGSIAGVQVAGRAPFRLTDVPVVDG
ncbi:OmpA family protein [Cellulomonas sp. zg-ZUI222]|uniref:OmpA family protein n=1 Tax=Cellulomonas wangleii TaxID=2816956 RepID=A0ABX8D5M8_9CELL|nr:MULTISPECIES: OmpA family protein [Cellulomonas]MBO0899760.1 OmpA family protein [Cellulomonas sp. zg-ZUI22]MBO0920622.1 OmpA family protein [Cellulomonas wangleii]MBO0922960.1 OmpA family protein [Cellulomonas wangleii]QVI61352.1 OmpA family protein [Cellulomonas wangleii]